MQQFQQRLPKARHDQWWMVMDKIFTLDEQ
ncbi:hypothetical protein [Tunturiibacter lichenicola]|jgi:hypothetical protein